MSINVSRLCEDVGVLLETQMSVDGSKEICFIKSKSLLYYIAGSLIEWIELF